MSKTLENGSFQDAVGAVVNAGTIEFVLSQDAMIIAGGQVAPTRVSATLDSSGDMPALFTILANDELTPSGTFYLTTVFDSNGARVFGPERWVFSGSSPIDLDTMTPTIVDPAFADPILSNPVADQAITAFDLDVLDLNAVRKADQFSGADAGAKIASAIADLPATGGIVDARGLEGAQTMASNVTIDAKVRVLLGAVTLSGAGRFLVNEDCSLIGLGDEATIFSYSGSGSAIVPQTSASLTRRVHLAGFRITGTSSGGIGIDALNARWWVGTDVRVEGFTAGQCVRVRGTTTGAHYNHFTRLHTSNGDTEFLVDYDVSGNRPNRGTCTDCLFLGGGANGVDIDGDTWKFSNSSWAEHTGIALRLRGQSDKSKFINVTMENATAGSSTGIQIDSGGNFIYILGNVTGYNTEIVDNSGSSRNTILLDGTSSVYQLSSGASTDIGLIPGSGVVDVTGQIKSTTALCPVANPLEGSLSNVPRWIFKQVDFGDMTAGATADTFALWTLPANTMIHDVVGTVVTGWSGGSISAAVASVGTQGGSSNDFALDDNFFAAGTVYELHDATANGGKGTALFDTTDKFAPHVRTVTVTIELQMDLTGDNHANATAGRARIYALVSQPLGNTTTEAN